MPPRISPSTSPKSSLKTSTSPKSSHSPLPRSRSVQFSPQDNKDSMAHLTASPHQTADSSADEITPIVAHERGPARGRDYNTGNNAGGDGNADTNIEEGEVPANGTQAGRERRSSAGSGRRRKGTNKSGIGSLSARRTVREGEGEGAEGKRRGEGVLAWLKGVLEKYGSVELDNKGSVARDHLALERTFLAWLRTSLAFASIGIAVTQLFRLNTTISEREGLTPSNPPNTYHLKQVGKPLGATFLGIAMLVLLIGGRRYFESQYWIIRGKFPASRGSIFLITFVAIALIITSLVVVCAVDPSVFEKR